MGVRQRGPGISRINFRIPDSGVSLAPWSDVRVSPRHVRRYCEPAAVLPGPAIGITPVSLLPIGRRVAGAPMDDGKVAQHPDLYFIRNEIPDRHRHPGLFEKSGAVDERLVGIGAI